MATNRKAKVPYLSPWSNSNNFSVYTTWVFEMSELIELVLKMIVRKGYSQKFLLDVTLKKGQLGRLSAVSYKI